MKLGSISTAADRTGMIPMEYGTIIAMSDAVFPISGFPQMHLPMTVMAAFRSSVASGFLYRLRAQYSRYQADYLVNGLSTRR